MAELVDAHDSKSCTVRCAGSIPASGTIKQTLKHARFRVCFFCSIFFARFASGSLYRHEATTFSQSDRLSVKRLTKEICFMGGLLQEIPNHNLSGKHDFIRAVQLLLSLSNDRDGYAR